MPQPSGIAVGMRSGTSLPATGQPGRNNLFFLVGGGSPGLYQCLMTDTWTIVASAGGGGTVTSVSVTSANGVSGSVATATTTPAITLTLGAITPTTVNKVTITAPATGATLTIPDGVTLNAGAGGTLGSNAFNSTSYVTTASLGTGVATFLTTPSSANLASAITNETGSGALVFATSPALVTPDLGTPTAAVLTSATGLPISTGVSGLGAGVATFLATPTSANLISAVTNETGSGALVFGTSPTIATPIITSIVPGANFLLTQNSISSFTSVESGAIVDTLRLDSGIVLVGTTASKTSASSGSVVLPNNSFLRGTTSAGTNTRGLIGLNSSNVVSIDTNSLGTVFGGNITPSASTSSLGTTGAVWQSLNVGKTITTAGTTGNQTINLASGSVNIAATGTTVTVTNNLVTVSSIVFAVIRTNDATARITNVVPGAGSFVINIVACTAEVSIGFFVLP